MPDLAELTLEQQMALRSAAHNLHREFDGVFGTETIERFLATSYAQFATQARIPTYLVLFAEKFARQRLKALAKVEGKVTDGVPVVLFLCTHNAGRSQMALAWFNHLAGGQAVAWSGGSEPGVEMNPAAVEAMAEVGIDITSEFPKPWTDEIVRAADVVVTMGCGDACPLFPGKRYEDWELTDPAGMDTAAVRPIRDEIRERVRNLLAELDDGRRVAAGCSERALAQGAPAVQTVPVREPMVSLLSETLMLRLPSRRPPGSSSPSDPTPPELGPPAPSIRLPRRAAAAPRRRRRRCGSRWRPRGRRRVRAS